MTCTMAGHFEPSITGALASWSFEDPRPVSRRLFAVAILDHVVPTVGGLAVWTTAPSPASPQPTPKTLAKTIQPDSARVGSSVSQLQIQLDAGCQGTIGIRTL